MARMPGTTWAGERSPRNKMDRYDIVCIHTIVGYAPAHAAHFSTRADGEIIQSRDTAYRSAANLDGNHRILSIENEDHGPRFGGTPRLPEWVPLTDEQVEACAQILAWAHLEHGVPLQMCPDSRPGSRGLAYHRQGIDGNFEGFRFRGRVKSGETWTSSFGKVCPTDIRIAQLPAILSRAQEIVNGDDMANYAEQLDRIEATLTEFKQAEWRRGKRLRLQLQDIISRSKDAATKADLEALAAQLPQDDD